MKQHLVLITLVLGLIGFAVPAAAQRGNRGGSSNEPESTPLGVQHVAPNAGAKYEEMKFGILKECSKDGLVLSKTQAGVDVTYKFDKKTKFIRDGKSSKLAALKAGDEVWVDADQNKKTGDLIAHKVVSGVFVMPSN